MALVEITSPLPAIVAIEGEGGNVIEIPLTPPAMVDVLTEGVQGTRGLPGEDGQDAVIPDPGDLILYFENGLT